MRRHWNMELRLEHGFRTGTWSQGRNVVTWHGQMLVLRQWRGELACLKRLPGSNGVGMPWQPDVLIIVVISTSKNTPTSRLQEDDIRAGTVSTGLWALKKKKSNTVKVVKIVTDSGEGGVEGGMHVYTCVGLDDQVTKRLSPITPKWSTTAATSCSYIQ